MKMVIEAFLSSGNGGWMLRVNALVRKGFHAGGPSPSH